MEGANSVVFKSCIVYVTRDRGSGKQVEWQGPTVVLKGLVTPTQVPPDGVSAQIHATMLRRQAADHQVLCGLAPHPNIVEVVHHFAAPALLLRPFVGEGWLSLLSLSKTT